jgi:hypothetical protein
VSLSTLRYNIVWVLVKAGEGLYRRANESNAFRVCRGGEGFFGSLGHRGPCWTPIYRTPGDY